MLRHFLLPNFFFFLFERKWKTLLGSKDTVGLGVLFVPNRLVVLHVSRQNVDSSV